MAIFRKLDYRRGRRFIKVFRFYESCFVLIIGFVIGCLLSNSYDNYNSKSKIIEKFEKSILKPKFVPRNCSNYPEAYKLYKKIKILCWVMTTPRNHKRKAVHTLRTWGTRCNKIIFISSAKEDDIPEIVVLPNKEGHNHLWAKTKAAFNYIYNNYFDEYDWFLKVDDDTYVIVENLRLLLNDNYPLDPIYFGFKFAAHVEQGYMSGGAGYVLSKEALRRFIEISLPDSDSCHSGSDGAEDVEMGKCLESVDVIAGDSRDKYKRGRFFIFRPEDHLLPGKIDENFWYWKYMYYITEDGLSCCSNYAISFHYILPNNMYLLDYLIYRAKPYGIIDKLKQSKIDMLLD